MRGGLESLRTYCTIDKVLVVFARRAWGPRGSFNGVQDPRCWFDAEERCRADSLGDACVTFLVWLDVRA